MVGRLSGWGLRPRPCDICVSASALLYCRADATFLCGACDMKIHVTVGHERVWMCEVCEQAPAAVTCKADAAVLCTSCDNDIHSANPLARRHERVPVIPFLDSAVDAAVRSSNTSANSTFLTPTMETATPTVTEKYDDEDAEAWLIPNPNSTVFYNESCLVVDCSYAVQKQYQQHSYENESFAFTDCIVPTKTEGNLSFSNTANHFFDTTYIDFSQPTKQQIKNNNQQHHLFSSFNFSAQHSVSSSDIGVVPEGNTNLSSEILCNSGASDGNSPANSGVLDREARVLRYREKRKNRKFQKTIRYASRKAYAETRPRIKGRFAKRTGNHEASEVSQMMMMGSDFGLDQEYGVVPTF